MADSASVRWRADGPVSLVSGDCPNTSLSVVQQ